MVARTLRNGGKIQTLQQEQTAIFSQQMSSSLGPNYLRNRLEPQHCLVNDSFQEIPTNQLLGLLCNSFPGFIGGDCVNRITDSRMR